MRNRTEPAEPNRTEPVEFRNRPELDEETNRTEPDRATTRPKNESRTALNRKKQLPNRTKPNRSNFEYDRTETNRTEPISCCKYQIMRCVLLTPLYPNRTDELLKLGLRPLPAPQSDIKHVYSNLLYICIYIERERERDIDIDR